MVMINRQSSAMEEAACACRDMVALGTKTPCVGVIWQQLTSDMKSFYVDTSFTGTLLKKKTNT